MTGEPHRRRVFLDADVLAAPMTRTLLVLASLADAAYVPRWSLLAEDEADRALRPGQTKVAELRSRFSWGANVLVDPVIPEMMSSMVDTSPTDRHILGAASQAGIAVVVTRNVPDFGCDDLASLGVVAVHPDMFAATILTDEVYLKTLAAMSAGRLRPPNTPETIHAALGAGHPLLFEAMQKTYPGVTASPSPSDPPAEVFRGNRCVVCGKALSGAESLALGVGPECRRRDRHLTGIK